MAEHMNATNPETTKTNLALPSKHHKALRIQEKPTIIITTPKSTDGRRARVCVCVCFLLGLRARSELRT